MIVKYLFLYFVLLCLGKLVRSQGFGLHDTTCKQVCQEWEGDRYAANTICRQKYKDCVQVYFQNFFEDKGPIIWRALKNLFTVIEECVDVDTKKRMDGTKCREICEPAEKQMEFESIEVCKPGLFCCQESRLASWVRRDMKSWV